MAKLSLEAVYQQLDEQQGVLVGFLNSPNPVPPSMLSDVSMKLSILNIILGEYVSELKVTQLNAETAVYGAYKAKSAAAATNEMRVQTVNERSAFQKADIKHTDMWKLISMAQSHIRALTEEQRNG